MNESKTHIPVVPEPSSESLCVTDCNGACCHSGVDISMWPDEADRMTELYGAELECIGDANTAMGTKAYNFINNCPNLEITDDMGICTLYETGEWRPLICDSFTAGSVACKEIRGLNYTPEQV